VDRPAAFVRVTTSLDRTTNRILDEEGRARGLSKSALIRLLAHALRKGEVRLVFYGPPRASFSPCRMTERARWPPYAPFCSDGIGLSVLPGALRLLGLAPVGCRRLTRSRVNVLAGRFILDAGCVVSAPLPALSGPSACAGPPYLGRGDVPQQPRGVTVGRPRSPGRARHPCGPIWT